MAGILPDPKAAYSDDGEVLFVIGLSASVGGPSCFVLAAAERVVVNGGKPSARRLVATFRDPTDALAVASTMDPQRAPVVYVRTPGGAWAVLVPLDIDGGRIAARRLTLKGVRPSVKPTDAQRLPGSWLGKGDAGLAGVGWLDQG